jgi:hypothetical protein
MQSHATKVDPPKRRRRWFQFSLRTLMIVVTLVAVPLGYVGWTVKIIRERTDMIAKIRGIGGEVMTLPSLPGMTLFPLITRKGELMRGQRPAIPAIRRWLGDEDVVFLVLNPGMSHEDVERVAAMFPEAIIADGGDFTVTYSTSPP